MFEATPTQRLSPGTHVAYTLDLLKYLDRPRDKDSDVMEQEENPLRGTDIQIQELDAAVHCEIVEDLGDVVRLQEVETGSDASVEPHPVVEVPRTVALQAAYGCLMSPLP